MNNIITYNNFINEAKVNWNKKITEEEAIKLAKSAECWNVNSPSLFRGTSDTANYLFIDPTKHIRVASGGVNFMNVLMDNLPEYAGIAKRSRSIICTTDHEKALEFGSKLNIKTKKIEGDVYYIIPLTNCLIGSCPDSDIWWTHIGIEYNDINDILSFISEMLYGYMKLTQTELPYHPTYNNLIKYLKKIPNITLEGFRDSRDLFERDYDNIIKEYNKFDGWSNWFEFLKIYLHPKNIGIKSSLYCKNKTLKKSSEQVYHNYPGQEFWVQGPCLLVNKEILADFLANF